MVAFLVIVGVLLGPVVVASALADTWIKIEDRFSDK